MSQLLSTELGKFPEAWKLLRVDSVFQIQQGKQVSKKNRMGDNQRPFLRTRNVFWDRLDLSDMDQMHFSGQEKKRLELRKGDLLLCEGGDIGRTAMWDGELERCYYQNHLHRLRALDGKVDPKYSVFWFRYAFDVAKLYFGRGNVTTIPNLSRSKLAELPMMTPPLPEQKKIAYVLSTVQRAIAQQERIIATTTELKKALMQKLFTEGLRGEPQKQTEIGPIPESWEPRRFGDIAEFKNGINFTSAQKGDKGILTVDVLNMYGDGSEVVLDKVYRVDKTISDDYHLVDGDLLFVRSSVKLEGVGWTTMFRSIGEPVTFCGFIIRARLGVPSVATPRFLTHYFRTDQARRVLVSGGAKVGITNINQGLLREIRFPLPSVEEQSEIAGTIERIDKKIALHKAKESKFQEFFHTLLHELMTAKVRVNGIFPGII